MFAVDSSQPILEPIHYLEEIPLNIVEKVNARRRRISKNKDTIKKRSISDARANKTIKRNVKQQNNVKLEFNMNESGDQEVNKNSIINDPLFTPEIEMKCEWNDKEFHSEVDDKDYYTEECDEEEADNDGDDECEINSKRNLFTKIKLKKNVRNHSDIEDDEPLILLSKQSTRRKYKKKSTPSLKSCGDSCKYKCTIKFDRQQRLEIYKYYSSLSTEDKVNFIRQHIRKPVIKRLRTTKFRNNCCYFLRCHQEIEQHDTDQANSSEKRNNSDNDEELTKVCRKFFDRTLRISDKELKAAIKDYELKTERVVRPLQVQSLEKLVKDKPAIAQQPKQYLDPETGDLTDTKPKKKSKRRKRGEPLPERFPKPINCAIRCKFKCHEKFGETERKQICDIFWSLDFKRRKDFILSRIETVDVKTPITPQFRKTNRPTRAYQTKFYLRSGTKSENIRVCKHFILNTLCTNRWFIENAIEFADKTTGAYTGTDRRGITGGFNKIPHDRKQTVLDHIESYPFWIPNKKSKTKYLHYSLNIKKMYDAYKKKCLSDKIDHVHVHYYYQVFHSHFHLLFLANPHPKKGRGYYKTNPNISHYTGDETGGLWIDSKGNKLDIKSINPALTLDSSQNNLSMGSYVGSNRFASASASETETSLAVVKFDLNPPCYQNLPPDTVNLFKML